MQPARPPSAQAVGDDAVLAEALALRGRAEAQLGMDATAVIDRALALESTTVALSTIDQPSDNLAEVRDWHDDLGAALTTLRRIVRDAEERGEEASVAWTLGRTAMLLCALGEPDAALRDAERAYEFTAESQRPENEAVMLGVIASIEAYRGDDARARMAAARALEVARTSGAGRPDRLVRSALGMLELSLGDAPAAHRQLEPLVARTRAAGIGEPGAMRFVPDEVEALIGIGDLESADELLGWYEGCAQRLDRQSALAASARCRGLLASGGGDARGGVRPPRGRDRAVRRRGAAARPRAHRAGARCRGAPPAAQARGTRDARGSARGIRRRRRAALGPARPGRARADRRPPRGAGELTAAERRVAELVGQGLSNREVASALFLSAKTVEFHLRNIFRKLGVRSRTELARRTSLGRRPTKDQGSHRFALGVPGLASRSPTKEAVMQSRTTKLLLTTLAVGALAAPVAAASQDLRSPDARDAATATPQLRGDLRSPDARDAARPVAVVTPAPVPAQRAAPEAPWFDVASAGIGAVALLLIGLAGAVATRTRFVRRHLAH